LVTLRWTGRPGIFTSPHLDECVKFWAVLAS
jgi:hypothetical protein